MSKKSIISSERKETHLTVVDGKMEMVECMMCGSIDDVLEWMAGDHVGIMNKNGPEVDKDE
jgi:hypothetical protein